MHLKLNKKGLELPLRVILLAFVIGIIILLIFVIFQQKGIIQIQEIWNTNIFEKIK